MLICLNTYRLYRPRLSRADAIMVAAFCICHREIRNALLHG